MSKRPDANREITGLEIEGDMLGVHLRVDRGEGELEALRFLTTAQAHRLADLLHEIADSSRRQRVAYAVKHPGELRDEAELLATPHDLDPAPSPTIQ